MADLDLLWDTFLETNKYSDDVNNSDKTAQFCGANNNNINNHRQNYSTNIVEVDKNNISTYNSDSNQEFIESQTSTSNNSRSNTSNTSNNITNNKLKFKVIEIPKCGELFISTQTKILHLNTSINLNEVFWKLPVMEYLTWNTGIIKKQMKFNSKTQKEIDIIQENLKKCKYYVEQKMTSIVNENGTLKDIRKISIGLSKKDIISYRCKQKSAFYNCFVLILRIYDEATSVYKEYHVKIFNTGKVEIPGIQNDFGLFKVMDTVVKILSPFINNNLTFKDEIETILINSNFNCGFNINRQKLFELLQSKYIIQAMYDPCSYPGIQCKYYYDINKPDNNGQQISENYKSKKIDKSIFVISFMIFRTGGVLIVGKCTESILNYVFEFIKSILADNYKAIEQGVNNYCKKEKKQNRKKKVITTMV